MHPVRTIIRRFDDWISRVEGVAPFTDDPGVILRVQSGRAKWEIPLPEEKIAVGSELLILHLWNERLPPLPPGGADLPWALRTQRSMMHSFRAVANYLRDQSSLQNIKAVGGVIAHIQLEGADGGRALLEHLGFTIFAYHRPLGAFGEFWENFYTWCLMWAYNPASMRHRSLTGLQRAEFWMKKAKFLEKYG